MRKSEADADVVLIDAGVISPEESRQRIIADEGSPYQGLDPNDVPDLREEEEQGLEPKGAAAGLAKGALGEEDDGAGKPEGGGADENGIIPFARDAASAWNESDHPRAPNGEFGSSGGGSSKPPKLTPTEKSYIDNYSGDEFLRLNTKLRSGEDGGPAAAKLDSAIAKGTIEPGTKLYRGVSKDGLKSLIGGDTLSIGQTLMDPAFLSTSTDRNIAALNSIGGVLMEIDVGTGQHVIDLEKISRNQHEKETLLPRNSKMKIVGLRAPKKPGDPIIVRVATQSSEKDADDDAEADHRS
jgi:hypothetical protein